MKTDDIFEALTDIDDNFIEEARLLEPGEGQPTVVRPAPKKPLWKTLVPIAACLAVVGTAGTLGYKHLRGHRLTETSSPATSNVYPASAENFQYPEAAKYIVGEEYYADPSLFNFCYMYDTNMYYIKWDNEDTYAKSYEELAAQSDLIIAGEFADYTHQTQDPSKVHEYSPDTDDNCFNYLRVENVIKGDVKAGQYVLIQQNDPISTNGDRAVQLNSDDRLTPMFKGDRWIYFLKKNGDFYELVNGPQGRYPMPGNNNVDVTGSKKVDEYLTLNNAAPARDEIYETVVALLEAAKPKLEEITLPEDGSEVGFTMVEFPAFTFRASNDSVMSVLKTSPEVDAVFENSLFGKNVSISNLYLADLNGDGKREICATVYDEEKGSSIMVCDFAGGLKYNDDGSIVFVNTTAGSLYALSAEPFAYEYTLAAEDGVLKAVKTEWHLPPVSSASKELSREPLTLDMMTRINSSCELEEIVIPLSGARNEFDMAEFPDFGLTATHESVLLNGYEMNAVDVPIISGDEILNLFLCDLNSDGKREFCATVVNNGVRSVEAVDFANNKQYTLQGKADNEYYLKTENEQLMSVFCEDNGECMLETHEPLSLDKMMPVFSNISALTLLGDEKQFMLAEFPDKTFEVIYGHIVMDDVNAPAGTMRNSVIGGMEYYLTDLNGDGKREICAAGEWGSGITHTYINVYDIANDENYSLSSSMYEGLLSLETENDRLYLVKKEYQANDVSKEISREPLTLDHLGKVPKTAYEEIPLFIDQTFTVADFPGVKFTVETSDGFDTFRFGWDNTVVENSVDRVYLYDLDGDGKREICLNCPFAVRGIIRVYGYMDNGEIGAAFYYEDGGCWIVPAEDGTLTYCTNDKREPFKFSKSDLRANLDQGYSYEETGCDRILDLGKIAPALDTYDISITNCMLKIGIGDDLLFASDTQLWEMYTIYDEDEPSLTLVFTEGDYTETEIGIVVAVKLSEGGVAQQYYYEDGVTLRPTAYELHIVKPDGTEEPFKFPENAETIS